MDGPPQEVLEQLVPILAITGGLTVAILFIVVEGIRRVAQTRMRETSRREIAAYVAEGSISADDAVRILSSGGSAKKAIRDLQRT
jgi:hypothetical protein